MPSAPIRMSVWLVSTIAPSRSAKRAVTLLPFCSKPAMRRPNLMRPAPSIRSAARYRIICSSPRWMENCGHGRLQAEAREDAHGAGLDVDADAERSELVHGLEHLDVEARAMEAHRGGEAADAG